MIVHCPAESQIFFTPVTAHWWIPTTAEVDVLHSNPSKVTPLQLGHCMSQRVEGARKIAWPAGLCTSRREAGPSYNENSYMQSRGSHTGLLTPNSDITFHYNKVVQV